MLLIACGLLLARLLAHLIGQYLLVNASYITESLLMGVFFTMLVQIGICFFLPFMVYKKRLGLNAREIFAFSNFNKTHWFNFVLAVPIGIVGIFVTMGISTMWMIMLTTLGYTSGGGASRLPDAFNPWQLVLQLFLVAVLPAICEEFAMRGGLFSVMRGRYKGGFFYIIMAIAFGLFHQNITQLGYTAFFGAIMAFVVVKTKSVYPAMIIHFVNNGLSVYLTFAAKYGFFMGNFNSMLENMVLNSFGTLVISYALIVTAFAGLLTVLHILNKNSGRLKDSAAPTNAASIKSPVGDGVHGVPQNTFYIGAAVTAAAFTLFSLIWGIFLA